MKRLGFILLLVLPLVTNAQWTLNFQTHTHQIIKALSAPTDQICWFVTNRDSLYKTEDRGLHWSKLPPSTVSFNPYGLFVLTPTIAFKSSNGSLFRTTDGGNNWTVVYTSTVAEPPVVYMKADLQTGILASNGQLYKTTDGGTTWSVSAITQPPFPIIGTTGKGNLWIDGDTIWAALRNKGVAVSTDFGTTWNLPTNTGLSFTGSGAIAFANSQLGAAIKQNSPYVYVTTDGGSSWSTSTNSLGANEAVLGFQSELWFIPNSADHFYVKHSADSGATWTQQLTDAAGFDVLEKSRSGSTLWTGSDQGTVYVYDAGLATSAPNTALFSIAPNPFQNKTMVRFTTTQEHTSITLLNVLGSVIRRYDFSGTELELLRDNLSTGIYYIAIDNHYPLQKLCIN